MSIFSVCELCLHSIIKPKDLSNGDWLSLKGKILYCITVLMDTTPCRMVQ